MKAEVSLAATFSAVVMAVVAVLVLAGCAPQQPITPSSSKVALSGTPLASPPDSPVPSPSRPPAAGASPGVPGRPASASIKMGHLVMLSGPLAMYGAMESDAVALALEDINDSGGINGSPLEVVRYDTRGDPQEAVSQFRKVVDQDKAVAVLGPFSSGEFEVTAPLAVENKVPALSIAGSPGIAANNRPWAFQIHIPFAALASPSVDVLMSRYPNIRNVAIAGDTKYRASESEAKRIYPGIFRDRGLHLVDTVEFDTATTDYSAIVTRIKGLDADALFISGVPGPAFGLLKELERQGFKKPLLLSGILGGGGSVIPLMGGYLEGTVISYWVDFSDKATQDWGSRWLSLVKADARVPQKPLFPSTDLSVYNAMMAVAKVMREARITADTPLQEARARTKDGLQGLKDYRGVGPKITVLPSGEWTWEAIPFVVKNGQPLVVR